jgi:hypothetical protein
MDSSVNWLVRYAGLRPVSSIHTQLADECIHTQLADECIHTQQRAYTHNWLMSAYTHSSAHTHTTG